MDNNLPIVVFNLQKKGNIARAVCGEPIGTVVGPAKSKPSGRARRKKKGGR